MGYGMRAEAGANSALNTWLGGGGIGEPSWEASQPLNTMPATAAHKAAARSLILVSTIFDFPSV
jgi:hypothetical protein